MTLVRGKPPVPSYSPHIRCRTSGLDVFDSRRDVFSGNYIGVYSIPALGHIIFLFRSVKLSIDNSMSPTEFKFSDAPSSLPSYSVICSNQAPTTGSVDVGNEEVLFLPFLLLKPDTALSHSGIRSPVYSKYFIYRRLSLPANILILVALERKEENHAAELLRHTKRCSRC